MKQSKEKAARDCIVYNDTINLPNRLSNLDDINFLTISGQTLLQTAVTLRRIDAIKILLKASGLSIEKVDKFGNNALHNAAASGCDNIIILLPSNVEIINSIGYARFTPLHKAVLGDYLSTASLLINLGANVNAITGEDHHLNIRNFTSLHIAAHRGNLKMIELLIKNGARTDILTAGGDSVTSILKKLYPEKLAAFKEIESNIQPKGYPLEEKGISASNKSVAPEEEVYPSKEKERVEESAKLKAELTGSGDELVVSFNQHHKATLEAPKVAKRKSHIDDNGKLYKKHKIIEEDGEEENFNSSSVENSESSSSSSSSPDPLFSGGSSIKARSATLADQQPTEIDCSSNEEQSTGYEQRKDSLQVINDKTNSIADNVLMMLFTWIKDLPEVLQQQVLSSFSMQQVLELLEKTLHPDKFIADQLNNQSVEEKLAAEYQKYYNRDNFVSDSQDEHAQVNQFYSPVFLDKDVEVISSDGVLIDPLPKHDINFGIPHLFGGIAS